MKDKVKRRRIVNQRKMKDLLSKYDQNVNPNNIAFEKEKQSIEKQQIDYDRISVNRLKLKLLKQKSKELNKEFLETKRANYSSKKDFLAAYQEAKNHRNETIRKFRDNLRLEVIAYREEYETTSYKIKRWFFGMGKEFSRISWSSKKTVFTNLIVVIGISLFLAVIFLLVDLIFSIL